MEKFTYSVKSLVVYLKHITYLMQISPPSKWVVLIANQMGPYVLAALRSLSEYQRSHELDEVVIELGQAMDVNYQDQSTTYFTTLTSIHTERERSSCVKRIASAIQSLGLDIKGNLLEGDEDFDEAYEEGVATKLEEERPCNKRMRQ